MALGDDAGTEAATAGDDFEDFESGATGTGEGSETLESDDDDAAETAQDAAASDLGDDEPARGTTDDAAEAAQDRAAGDDDDTTLGGFSEIGSSGAAPPQSMDGADDAAEQAQDRAAGETPQELGGGVVADDLQQGQLDSAEAAEDLAAAGVTLGGSQPEDAAEAAADLASVGLVGAQARGRRLGRRLGRRDDAAERAQDFVAGLNAGDIATDPAEAVQDRAARTATRPERFGDVDTSQTLDALGFGQPGVDEVERFTDETLPAFVKDQLPRETNPVSGPEPATVSAGPFVSPGASLGRIAAPGSPVRGAAREFAVSLSQTPAAVLEGIEAAPGVVSAPTEAFTSKNRAGFVGPAPSPAQQRAAEDIGVAVRRSGAASVQAFQEEPVEEATGLGLGVALSAGSGVAVSRGARLARARFRTAGATELDPTDLAGQDVVDTFDPDATPERQQRFPPFREDIGVEQQAAALERQSAEFTPEEIEAEFGGPAPEGAADLKKALDVEPEGAGGGTGLQAPPTDSDLAEAFESVGTSLGPEASPNFLRIGQTPEFSLRPGLPSLGGNNPTLAVVRSRITETDAGDLAEFNEELRAAEEAGETDVRTLPPDEFTPGEAEAVAPPGAVFEQITDTGPLARRGIGSQFAAEFAGEQVPVRLFRDPDLDPETAAEVQQRIAESSEGEPVNLADLGGDMEGDLITARELRRRARQGERPVDRPLPIAPVTANGTANVSEVAGAESRVDLIREETAPPSEAEEPERLSPEQSEPDVLSREAAEPGELTAERVAESDRQRGGGQTSGSRSTFTGSQPSSASPILGRDSGGFQPPTSVADTSGGEKSAPSTPPGGPSESIRPPGPPSTPSTPPGPPSTPSTPPGPPSTPSTPPGPPIEPPPPPTTRRGDDPDEGEGDDERQDEAIAASEFQLLRAVGEVDELVTGGDIEGAGEAVPEGDAPVFEALEALPERRALDDLIR